MLREETYMIVKGDDGGTLEIGFSCDGDIWIRTLNEMHAPIRIRTYFGGAIDDRVYKIFQEFVHKLEDLDSKQIIK